MAQTFSNAIAALLILVACLEIATGQHPCPSRCRSCINNMADCSKRSLPAPPRFYPAGTRTINLEDNHIRVIAVMTFGNLDSMEVLKLARNKIFTLNYDAFRLFPNLTHLDLTDNRISIIDRRAFIGLDKLWNLTLNQNKLTSLEGIFQYVPNLVILNVANNTITAIGQNDLAALSSVISLDFGGNLITSIHSQAFKNLTDLRWISLNNNPLMSTPHFEFSSQDLYAVGFSNCRLRQVPGSFPSSVIDLWLDNNTITQVLSSDFTNITELERLMLNHNGLHSLADNALSHLHKLREIWLRNNSLMYIPRGIPNNVRKIYMELNNIQQIELGLFSNMLHLEHLSVERNQINRIQPNTFRGLNFLNALNLQFNRIQSLESDTFADLGSLSRLGLSYNPIVRIEGDAFRNLANLSQLFLSEIVGGHFQLSGNFFPQMLRLQRLILVNSPKLVNALMYMINDSAAFSIPLQFMHILDLRNNTLECVSPRVREVFPNLVSMPLDGNPFRCSRGLKWLRDWMLSSEVTFHYYEEIVCETPLRLKDRPVRSIEDHEWGNYGENGENEDEE